jgi:hypothetical protein
MRLDVESSPSAFADAVKPMATASAATAATIIDPVVLAKPNLALWVTKDHR